MMVAKNLVVEGDYKGQRVNVAKGKVFIGKNEINKITVKDFEVINENSSTKSITSGKTNKSMIGTGTKGAVGAVVGSVFGPVGTVIGAGAGLATSKSKTKSVTNEVTLKDITVVINFNDGKQSVAKMDGVYYDAFLISTYSDPTPLKSKKNKEKKESNKNGNRTLFKTLGWIFVPYIMTIALWKKLSNQSRTFGVIWSVISLLIVFIGQSN